MKRGLKLIRDVEQCRPAKGECAFWWLGQQGFIVKFGARNVYFDPFLSAQRRRRIKPLLRPSEVVNADFVLGSHDHGDHIDRAAWPVIAESSPRARFVVPSFLLPSLAADLGMPRRRFIGLDDGKSVDLDGITISAVASAHEFLDRDPRTGRYPYLGYVVEGNGATVYHAGDTCLYEGLQAKLRRWALDVAFLPINGRDARRLARNCIGNMTYQEAADLAGALAPGLTVPAHYDMFAGNGISPKYFADYMRVKYPNLKCALCRHGTRMIVRRRRRGHG